jgi:hypothetical protein
VHIFVRTRTFLSYLIGAFILCTTPEAVVVFRAQIMQNAVQTFYRLLFEKLSSVNSGRLRKRERLGLRLEVVGTGTRRAHIQPKELYHLIYRLRLPRVIPRTRVPRGKIFIVVKWFKRIRTHLLSEGVPFLRALSVPSRPSHRLLDQKDVLEAGRERVGISRIEPEYIELRHATKWSSVHPQGEV